MIDIEHIKIVLSDHGYEYIDTIGIGSYSHVFLCKSLKYNELFSIKCISNIKVTDSEYSALIHLFHRNIIQLFEFFSEEDFQYLVLEYCSNNTLLQKGKLDYDEFVHYSRQILEALSYCHSKMIAHRDIKPDNIFLDKYGRVKLADFGFSKQFNKGIITDERCGSTMYCSPEIIKGHSLFNPFQADIYALGITFFYMITGKLPFCNSSIDGLKRSIIYGQVDFSQYKVDLKIQNMIMKMTTRNPKLRPTTKALLNLPIYNQEKPRKMQSHMISSKSQNKFILPMLHTSSNSSLSNESNTSDESSCCRYLVRTANHKHKNIITCPNVHKNCFYQATNQK